VKEALEATEHLDGGKVVVGRTTCDGLCMSMKHACSCVLIEGRCCTSVRL
jgi:hypothetical protein